MNKTAILLGMTLSLAAGAAQAAWVVDNTGSRLSFISIKNVDAAETHRFAKLRGRLADDGSFQVDIELDSVDTSVEIRDERMREVLFETGEHPVATVSGQINPEHVSLLKNGDTLSRELELELTLHGKTTQHTTTVRVVRAGGALEVASIRPILLNAASLGLADGVEKLREIAGLSSISKAVPVHFHLRLTRE